MVSKTGETFSRSKRLTHANEFKQVFKNNIRVSDDCITLLIGKRRGNSARLGFAIAKKQLKRAIDRNRIKRLLRESFRLRHNELPNVDIVIMVRHNIIELNHAEIFSRLNKHWQQIIDLCEN